MEFSGGFKRKPFNWPGFFYVFLKIISSSKWYRLQQWRSIQKVVLNGPCLKLLFPKLFRMSTVKRTTLKGLGNQIGKVYETLYLLRTRVPDPPLPIHGKFVHSVQNRRPRVCCMSEKKSGAWFTVKMLFYKYKKYRCGDKTVVRSSYLHSGNSYTGKMASL